VTSQTQRQWRWWWWFIYQRTCWAFFVSNVTTYLRGVYSNTTQLNSTQLTQLNSVQPSQSCFCLWRHDLQTKSTVVQAVELSSVELSCVAINTPLGLQVVNSLRVFKFFYDKAYCWLHGTVVERQSLTGELSLSCARPAADGWPLMWVNRPL